MKRYSKSTFTKNRNKLIYFAKYIETHFNKGILNADKKEVLHFLENDIDKRKIVRVTKEKWRYFINSYYNYIEKLKKLDKEIFFNPVPGPDFFQFYEKEITIEDLEKEEEMLTYETTERILKHYYYTNFMIFVIVCLLLYTGARISEIISIKLSNINLQERFIFVKIKSKKYLNQFGFYFFPKFFVRHLEIWIGQLELIYPDTIFLFPSSRSNFRHLTGKTVRHNLRDIKKLLNLEEHCNPHAFRNLLNEKREAMGVSKLKRTILLNQKPQGVNEKNYLKSYKTRKKLLGFYDESFPFPEFNPYK